MNLLVIHRANLIRDLVNDHEKLREERKSIKILKERLSGNQRKVPITEEKSMALKSFLPSIFK